MDEEPPLERKWMRSSGLSADEEAESGKIDLTTGTAGATALGILSGFQVTRAGGDLRRRMGEVG